MNPFTKFSKKNPEQFPRKLTSVNIDLCTKFRCHLFNKISVLPVEAGNILCTGVSDELLVQCVLDTNATEVQMKVILSSFTLFDFLYKLYWSPVIQQ